MTEETELSAEITIGAQWNYTLPAVVHPNALEIVSIDVNFGEASYFLTFNEAEMVMQIEEGASIDHQAGLYLI